MTASCLHELSTFSHPDYTVGPGFAPGQPPDRGSWAGVPLDASPPIGNWRVPHPAPKVRFCYSPVTK